MKHFNLDSEPKITSGFTTPEHYFEQFSEKLLQRIPKEEPKVISFWAKHKSWMYATAAIITVSLSIPLMNVWNSTSDEVQTAELENYLTYQSTLTDDQIIEHLDVSDLNNIDIESNVTNEEIEAILMENTDIEYQLIN
jgi:hypothetical protein